MKTQTIQFLDHSINKELEEKVKKLLGKNTAGGLELYIKTVILFTVSIFSISSPYFFAFPLPVLFICYPLLAGSSKAGIGMAVMHDASHGSYSKNQKINKWISIITLLWLGAYRTNWYTQHNKIHHPLTNVDEHDDDLGDGKVFRFSPNQKRRWHHQFQHIYAPVLYSLMTILWITTKDFTQARRYQREGRTGFENFWKHFFLISASKILYYAFWLGLPLLFWKTENWAVFASFVGKELVAGLILSMVFQPAHVTSLVVFPKNAVFNSRTEHQLSTSCNYAMGNKFITWFTGGLNFQIEHHLFSSISHVHYPKIAPVVRAFAKEKGLRYNDLGSYWDATKDHFRQLRELGKKKPQLV